MELALGFVADGASGHNYVNIFSPFRPEKVFPKEIQGLVQAKVTYKGSSMGFPN